MDKLIETAIEEIEYWMNLAWLKHDAGKDIELDNEIENIMIKTKDFICILKKWGVTEYRIRKNRQDKHEEQNKKLIGAVKKLSNYLYDTQFVSKHAEAQIDSMTENIDNLISEIEGE